MKSLKLYLVFCFCVLLGDCGSKSDSVSKRAHESGKTSELVVHIQPLGNVDPDYLTFVKNSLQNDFSSVKILPKMNLPQKA